MVDFKSVDWTKCHASFGLGDRYNELNKLKCDHALGLVDEAEGISLNIVPWVVSNGYTIYGTLEQKQFALQNLLLVHTLRPVVKICIKGFANKKQLFRTNAVPLFEQQIDITRFVDEYGKLSYKKKQSGLESTLQAFVDSDNKTVQLLRIKKKLSWSDAQISEFRKMIVDYLRIKLNRKYYFSVNLVVDGEGSDQAFVYSSRENNFLAHVAIGSTFVRWHRRRKLQCTINVPSVDKLFYNIKSDLGHDRHAVCLGI
uniref:Uncharacterized protein n=1 Tax=Mucochytrium quahogii TaxID=96639 RepID=A0A7S2WCC7_9STRA|mmetsp:Transcript_5031/g.7666  ORF Transcript_5031/g.7666 Transcript_5031/m.7666 type:complete len:256 (+) Transcript_5031:295-1062(+)